MDVNGIKGNAIGKQRSNYSIEFLFCMLQGWSNVRYFRFDGTATRIVYFALLMKTNLTFSHG